MTTIFDRDLLYDLTSRSSFWGLPVAGVIGVVVPFLLGMTNFTILGLYLAVPMILAPFAVRVFSTGTDTTSISVRSLDWRAPSVLIHLAIGLLIYMTASFPVRPTWFYVVYAAVYVLLFILILTGTGPVHTINALYHLCVTLLVSIYSVTLNYNYFFGREDVIPHEAMVRSLYETGALPERWQLLYEPFALWHAYVGASYSLLGQRFDPHTTLVLLSGLIFAAGVPIMYALAIRVTSNERVSLLSCLVLIAIPEYMFVGMYAISRSVTAILFIALLFTLVCSASPRMRLLRILFTAGIVVYHPITIPFLAVLLVILYGAERIFASRPYVVDNSTMGFIWVITSVYWLYRAEDFTSYLVTEFVKLFTGLLYGGVTEEGSPTAVFEAPWREVANYTPYSFLVLFVLVGFLFWFLRDRDRSGSFAAFAVASVVMIPLLYPSPLLLVDALSGVSMMEGRFASYGYAFVALVSGYGLYMLLKRGGKRAFLALLLLLACFSFVAVSNDFVASDNPVVERPFYTYYLTEAEESTIERVVEIHEGTLGADYITCHYSDHILTTECETFTIEDDRIALDEYDGVIIREGEFEERPIYLHSNEQYADPDSIPRDELSERDRIHDSGSVSYYR